MASDNVTPVTASSGQRRSNTIENVTNDINKVDFLKSELNPVEDEEFSPDKLRSNIERLYMTVIVGLMNLWKHIVRLRSWREQRRTAAFCVVSPNIYRNIGQVRD